MISYRPLRITLAAKEIKKTQLIKLMGLSSRIVAKFDTNEYVSLEIIDRLCYFLKCQPKDLIEYVATTEDINKEEE